MDAVIAVTLDGVVTSWNAGAEAIYGYTAEEMTGRHVSVVYPPDRIEELAPILDQIRCGRPVHHYETRRVRKDGTVIDVSISTSPVRDGSGAIVGAAGVSRDVTERNWAEAEHRADEARQREAERMETQARLVGGIASEFSSLLSAIMGYTASVATATTGDPRVQADVQQIQAAAGSAARLARELLLFSRREPTRPERVDLNAVLTGARGLLRASLGTDIELRLITAPRTCPRSGPTRARSSRCCSTWRSTPATPCPQAAPWPLPPAPPTSTTTMPPPIPAPPLAATPNSPSPIPAPV